jgi:hypothetical protein
MLTKNITKISSFVIFTVVFAALSAACTHELVTGGRALSLESETLSFDKAEVVGRIENRDIGESSGLTASKCQDGVFWTHNDSGHDPFIYALDAKGGDLGVWKVQNAENIDWEDIASVRDPAGICRLYLGEIGNSKDGARRAQKVYRVVEPVVERDGSTSDKKGPATTLPAESFTFSYPDKPRDAEALFVEPLSGAIYVATKERSGPSFVFKLMPDFDSESKQIAEKIGEIVVPAMPIGLLTSGDISPDGRHLVICDYFAGHQFELNLDRENMQDSLKRQPVVIDLGKRKQGEAIAYTSDGNGIFATSEGKNSPMIYLKRR